MKKNYSKIFSLITSIISATTIFSLFSCQDVIFEEIRKEVKLEKAQISGSINSIVRYEIKNVEVPVLDENGIQKKDDSGNLLTEKKDIDYIFLQNGSIWKKEAALESAHNWSSCARPSTSADYNYVNKIAADADYLYAQVTTIKKDDDEGENIPTGNALFYSDDGAKTWKSVVFKIDGKDVTSFSSGCLSIFCTNSVKNDHRKAFAKYYDSTENKYTIYELNGEIPVAKDTIQSDLYEETDYCSTKPTYSTKSCTYFNGSVYFCSGNAITTNESASSDATCMYYTSKSDCITYKTSSGESAEVDVNTSTIYSLAITKDYIYLGTGDGIEHVSFTEDDSGKSTLIPNNYTSDFTTNADSTLSSYYVINCVLVINPDVLESVNTIYGTTVFSGSSSSTSATQDNQGLWAYYAKRGKWNRE